MGLGWGVAYQVFFSKSDVPAKYGQFLFWGIFLSAWIGSKLFFYFNTDATQFSLMEVSFWTGGGFVFYGGLISALVFIGLYKLAKFPLTRETFWAMIPALTLGHAIGRIGCLLAGCCYGAVTDWWWGINLHGSHRHPTQALESLGLFILAFYILKYRRHHLALSIYCMGYGILRFMNEMLRGDEIRGFWGPLTPSQWISAVLIIVGFNLIVIHKYKGIASSKAI